MAKKTAWDWALTSGLSTGIGKKKGKPQAPEFQPYSGYRPPHVSNLRGVEDLTNRIIMERAQGQGVGYDPARREELLKNFEIQQNRDLSQNQSDIQNRISGMGLSRNPAVYDELIGRANRNANQEKNLYTNRVDIEDLARRNEERDVNTGRLQNLNSFNFGQENNAANFDLAAYNAEQPNRYRSFDAEQSQYQDPWGTALETAGKVGGLYADYQTGGLASTLSGAMQTPTYQGIHSSSGPGVRKDPYNNYLSNLALTKKGYNLQF